MIRARGGAVGKGTALTAGRCRFRFPTVSLEFFHWHKPFGRTMALGSKWVPGIFSWGEGVKGSRCLGLTTLPSSRLSRNPGPPQTHGNRRDSHKPAQGLL